jgi:hypothetical protein
MMRIGIAIAALLWLSASLCAAQDDALPTLDELLNITPSRDDDTPRPSSDDAAVSGATSGETLDQVFEEMRAVSQRLGRDRDVGLDTQRIQQRILDKLDQVIRAAQQAQRSGGSGLPQNPTPQDQGASGNQAQPEQGDTQGPAGGENRGVAGDPAAPPDATDAATPLHQRRIEWGNLPPRLRDELLQGSGERFSPVYQDMTEAYYRRLAEEEP